MLTYLRSNSIGIVALSTLKPEPLLITRLSKGKDTLGYRTFTESRGFLVNRIDTATGRGLILSGIDTSDYRGHGEGGNPGGSLAKRVAQVWTEQQQIPATFI